MYISWNWLKRFVNLDGVEPLEIVDLFTRKVAEVEGVRRTAEGLDDIRTFRIDEVEPIPDTRGLFKVIVWTGDGHVQGVTGAPNTRKGMIVPGCLAGGMTPAGPVKSVTIKGVESNLVLLSEKELGLTDDHSGLMDLGNVEVGKKLTDVMDLVDWVIEIDNKSLTHRPDLWGHEGIAREVAILANRRFNPPKYEMPSGEDSDPLDVEVMTPQDCPRYMAVGFDNVEIKKSPFWMRYSLFKVGLRAINNVVDITNFVMLDTGNPVHAFDRDRLRGNRIIVRRAYDGEVFTTLDGVEHKLTAEDLVIADEEGAIALAGVMGGENSEIQDTTTRVVLEAANFAPALIRRTALRHATRTDSSARFEKSLDPNLPQRAVGLFWHLLKRLSPDARVVTKVHDVKNFENKRISIHVELPYIAQRLGIEVDKDEVVNILRSLEFEVTKKGDALDLVVPTFRATKDISIKEDIVEEVGRLLGYDRITPRPPLVQPKLVPRLRSKEIQRAIVRFLTLYGGLDEVKTYSFYDNEFNERFGFEPKTSVKLMNPVSKVMDTLRTNLIPNLLMVMQKNAAVFDSFGVFELGRVFCSSRDKDIPVQPRSLGIVMYDKNVRKLEQKEGFLIRLKGLIQTMIQGLDLQDPDLTTPFESKHPWVHPKASALIQINGKIIGQYGLIHPYVMKKLNLKGAAGFVHMDIDVLSELPQVKKTFKKISKYPHVDMDVSIIVPQNVPVQKVRELIEKASGEYLVDCTLRDIYRGTPVPEGYKSVTWRFRLQAEDRTLSDAEIRAILDEIIASAPSIGGKIREE